MRSYLKKTYGLADFATKSRLTEESVFQSASVSKTFTAAAVFQLIEEKKLSLSAKLIDFFPELPYSELTIRHLLDHTSGLYPYNPLFAKNWDHSEIATNADIISMYARIKPDVFFEPGTEFAYCNVGYVFLASIVEKVSGLRFEEYLQKHIFAPLQMNKTRVYTLLSGNRIDDFAHEHILDPFSGSQKNPLHVEYHSYVRYLSGKVGDDKVATTLGDLWKWNRALFQANFLGDKHTQLAFTISNAGISGEKRHSKFDYGLGFQLDSLAKIGKVIYHNGGEPGLKVRFHYYPDQDISLILYSNAYPNYIRNIKNAILAILSSQSYRLPKKSIAEELAKVASFGKDKLSNVIDLYKSDTTHYYLSESEINNIAGVFWSQEEYDIGFNFLELNLELFEESVRATYTLGEGYMETGQMEKAIPYFERAKALMLNRPVEKQKVEFIEYLDGLINQHKTAELEE